MNTVNSSFVSYRNLPIVTNDHRYVPRVVNTSLSFPNSWLITEFETRLTRRVPLVEQDVFTLSEHVRSPPVFSGVRVTRSLVLCVIKKQEQSLVDSKQNNVLEWNNMSICEPLLEWASTIKIYPSLSVLYKTYHHHCIITMIQLKNCFLGINFWRYQRGYQNL
jgi:hypothetical protein